MTNGLPPTQFPDLDAVIARYVDLQLEEERIREAKAIALDQIRMFGLGQHRTSTGIRVSITPPNRRFNLDAACKLLPEAVLETCRPDGYDPAKVKAIMPPVLLDRAMDPGTGPYRVTLR